MYTDYKYIIYYALFSHTGYNGCYTRYAKVMFKLSILVAQFLSN